MIIGHHSDDWPRSEACPVGDMADEKEKCDGHRSDYWPSAEACPVGDMADENVDVMAIEATTGRVLRPAPWALWPMQMWM